LPVKTRSTSPGLVNHGNAYHLAETRLGNANYLHSWWGISTSSVNAGVDRVCLTPLWIPRKLTVDAIISRITVASALMNFRQCIYADNGGTPQGGALLFDSGDILSAANTAFRTAFAPIQLPRGLVWVGIATQDGVITFIRALNVSTWMPAGSAQPMMDSCFYTMGGWGALTNPCPVVTQDSTARPSILLHIVSIDE